MKKASLTLPVVVLAAAVAAACSETRQENLPPGNEVRQEQAARDANVTRQAQAGRAGAAAAPQRAAADEGQISLEEITVTGSRISSPRLASAAPHVIHDRGVHIPQPDRENYAAYGDNPIQRVLDKPVSTFSIDVDTGSYSNVRRMINAGSLPPADAVRAEELVNYFSYDYPAPEDPARPFSIHAEIAPSPWNEGRHLLHVGLKGYRPAGEAPPANLVFLVDVSGSMQSPDKLELLKTSLKLLAAQLDADDRISLVVYAGASGVVLEPTPGSERAKIAAALDRLHAGGSTNGGAGIQLAYAKAREAFIEDGINRVILATDGDFNVGLTDFDALIDLIGDRRESGVTLTTLGFGTGNYNDHLMERLADAGNGNHAYIDNLNEARKVLVDEMASTLQVIAGDVKIQVEFNPALVSEYRLVGYENRQLRREDFNDDRVDAGEVGAGHSVTALYEISLAGSGSESVAPLRYQTEAAAPATANREELAWFKLRYKPPGADSSLLIEQPLRADAMLPGLDEASDDYRFSAAVAGLAQLLRGNAPADFGYQQVLALAEGARGQDRFGYRAEFLNLVRTASVLDNQD